MMAVGCLLLLLAVALRRGRGHAPPASTRGGAPRPAGIPGDRPPSESGRIGDGQGGGAGDGHVKSVAAVNGNAILASGGNPRGREWVFAPGTDESVSVGVTFNGEQ